MTGDPNSSPVSDSAARQPAASRPHILVTGAASGIGAAIALEFARWLIHPASPPREQSGQTSGQPAEEAAADLAGTLYLVDLDPEGLSATADRIARLGNRPEPKSETSPSTPPLAVSTHVVDLARSDGPQDAVAQAWSTDGPVDVLVNAAGRYPSLDMVQVTAQEWDGLLALNTRAPVLATAELARRATSAGRGASIVNISSGAALRSRPGGGPYASSKAALEMATRAAALELGRYGIRVNAVSPGFVPVDSAANPVTEAYAQAAGANPLGRSGSPDDVARAVRWLSSPDAGWITGEVLRVDGGSSTGALSLPRIWPPEPEQDPPHHPGAPNFPRTEGERT